MLDFHHRLFQRYGLRIPKHLKIQKKLTCCRIRRLQSRLSDKDFYAVIDVIFLAVLISSKPCSKRLFLFLALRTMCGRNIKKILGCGIRARRRGNNAINILNHNSGNLFLPGRL